jgi:hypothetical protein
MQLAFGCWFLVTHTKVTRLLYSKAVAALQRCPVGAFWGLLAPGSWPATSPCCLNAAETGAAAAAATATGAVAAAAV